MVLQLSMPRFIACLLLPAVVVVAWYVLGAAKPARLETHWYTLHPTPYTLPLPAQARLEQDRQQWRDICKAAEMINAQQSEPLYLDVGVLGVGVRRQAPG